MTKHAKKDPIARGAEAPTTPEEHRAEPRFALLFLDEDAMYRWYEEDRPTDAAAHSLRLAIAAGSLLWPRLEILEIRGEAVAWFEPEQFEETYAAEELQELTDSQ